MIEVVAALICEKGHFLIGKRPAHKARGGLWEFVGGKVETGESKENALIRECREELDVLIDVGQVYMEVIHKYPDITVHLTLFKSKIIGGTLKLLEHSEIAWINPVEIKDYKFCPADEIILEKIIEKGL